ncbi:uncharacterized protein LOC100830576 [Brachypodium distachyon]|uniref:R3H domain-containing protein n=1 Tax=Brachypodium distachyon TaxID=15368 RepID=I1J3P4_BRADI|nr:uncharacterized protein LOC100830576 [Brachypodium distachyon]KQJ85451.1 hypothetical protein BRADI_5g27120v3 [Brachypodium distachyon]|eukprot:XP_003579526.1 uncharacterized protein LOC100830576 [Brachypodium distachyon]
MPATDSTSSPATHTSFGRSLLSLRHRDHQIHHAPPTPDHNTTHASSSAAAEIDAFQHHAADLLLDLLPSGSSAGPVPEILSLAWTRHLLDSFLVCLEEFRSLLFASPSLARPPLDRLLSDFFDRAVKALDLCNALRDGLDLLRQWRKHLAIAAAALSPHADDPSAPLGQAQIRRARKALTDLTILMLDDKDTSVGAGHRNRSFGLGSSTARGGGGDAQARGHHRRSSSGGSSGGSGSGSHFRSLSWSVSRSWSASRQLQAIGGNLPVPRAHDVAATGGLASAVYTMGSVLFVVAWALVAAIPCQDRGLQAHFAAPRSFPWAGPVTALYERVLEESKKKDRKHSCGLLKEIHQVERCSRQLMEITDAAQFPLDEEKDAEVREAALELVQVCETLKDGLDPLERQVREMFHRIVRTRTEILDSLSRPHTTE